MSEPTKPPTLPSVRTRSLWMAILNMVLCVAAIWLLMHQLNYLKNNRIFASERVDTVQDTIWTTDTTFFIIKRTIITTLPASDKEVISSTDTSKVQGKPELKKLKISDPDQKPSPPQAVIRPPRLTFYDVLVMMLIAGVLGGVLCNLRGIFGYYRDESLLPAELHIPYLTRPFTAAICGVFIYFVASLLITSVTLIPSENVGFQGMITYMALAIVAGFGSQEFMERLKALAVTLFGERQQDTMMQRLLQIERLKEKGIIDDDEFQNLKQKIISDNATDRVLESLQQLRTFNPPQVPGKP